jgi:timeless protein
VVTAIREFLQALEVYKRSSHLSVEDKQSLKYLQLQISSTEDLRCLFILLLRSYNSNLQSRQYLQDLIVTNHILLMLIDDSSIFPEQYESLKILEHLRQ